MEKPVDCVSTSTLALITANRSSTRWEFYSKFMLDRVIDQGCNGNTNRFESASECREKCAGVSADDADAASGHGMVLAVRKCRASFLRFLLVLSYSEVPGRRSCGHRLEQRAVEV